MRGAHAGHDTQYSLFQVGLDIVVHMRCGEGRAQIPSLKPTLELAGLIAAVRVGFKHGDNHHLDRDGLLSRGGGSRLPAAAARREPNKRQCECQ